MKILAIDPGNTESAYVLMNDDYSIQDCGFAKFENRLTLMGIQVACSLYGEDLTVVIEKVASYGMAVGAEVFETCIWIGRFAQAAMERGCRVEYVYRLDEKLALCHDSRAMDSNIRQALVDRFAKFDKKTGKGTKKHPDWFYGFSRDIWSAYAVGVTWLDRQQG